MKSVITNNGQAGAYQPNDLKMESNLCFVNGVAEIELTGVRWSFESNYCELVIQYPKER